MNNILSLNAKERIKSNKLETKIRKLCEKILEISEIESPSEESKVSEYIRRLHSLKIDYLILGRRFGKTKNEREREEELLKLVDKSRDNYTFLKENYFYD